METINNFITEIKPITEIIYFVSSIFIAIFAYYGLQQITILKTTSATQAKRDALRLTSEQCTTYFEKIIPLYNDFILTLEIKKIKYFDGWTIEVKGSEISATRKTPPNTTGLMEIYEKLAFLNNLEAFSVYFTSRVADEKVAYDTLGKTFLGTVEKLMPWIINCRKEGHFKNIVELFALWKPRLDREKLIAEKKSIEKKLANAETTYHAPIGADQ